MPTQERTNENHSEAIADDLGLVDDEKDSHQGDRIGYGEARAVMFAAELPAIEGGEHVSIEMANNPFAEHAPRSTRQRRAVVAVLNGLDHFVSAQSIHEELTALGDPIGLSTVYRTLQALLDANALDSVRSQGGELLYRSCGSQSHHHLVCHQCGRAAEIPLSAVERWAREVAELHGYTQVSHALDIFGLCPECSAGTEE